MDKVTKHNRFNELRGDRSAGRCPVALAVPAVLADRHGV